MGKPITIHNVSNPNFENFGAISAAHSRNVNEGLANFDEQINNNIERRDTRLTAAALRDRLTGGPMSKDNRVDIASVEEAFDARRINASNLLTAGLEQSGLEIGNEQAALDLEQDPIEHSAYIAAQEAAKAQSDFGLKTDKYDQQRTELLDQLTDNQRNSVIELDNYGKDLLAAEYDDLYAAEFGDALTPGTSTEQPTEDDVRRLRVAARANFEGIKGTAQMEKRIREMGLPESTIGLTQFGGRRQAARDVALAGLTAAAEREETYQTLVDQDLLNRQSSNFSGSGVGPGGGLVTLTKAEVDAQKIGNYKDIKTKLAGARLPNGKKINMSGIDDKKDKDILEQAASAYPNRSLFVHMVGAFINPANGELDRKSLQIALNGGINDITQQAIDDARAAQGLSSVTLPNETGGSGSSGSGGAVTPAGSNTSIFDAMRADGLSGGRPSVRETVWNKFMDVGKHVGTTASIISALSRKNNQPVPAEDT